MKILIPLFAAIILGCATKETASRIFSGGNGGSHEDAIIIHHGRDDAEIRAAVESWLRNRHIGARLVERTAEVVVPSSHGSGRAREYERVTFVTTSGETKTVYFDVTEFVR
jgi:hypothetical protein